MTPSGIKKHLRRTQTHCIALALSQDRSVLRILRCSLRSHHRVQTRLRDNITGRRLRGGDGLGSLRHPLKQRKQLRALAAASIRLARLDVNDVRCPRGQFTTLGRTDAATLLFASMRASTSSGVVREKRGSLGSGDHAFFRRTETDLRVLAMARRVRRRQRPEWLVSLAVSKWPHRVFPALEWA